MAQAGNVDQRKGNTSDRGMNSADTIVVERCVPVGRIDENFEVVIKRKSWATLMHYWVSGNYKGKLTEDLTSKHYVTEETKGHIFKKTVKTYPTSLEVIQITNKPFAISRGIAPQLSDGTAVDGTITAGLFLYADEAELCAFYLNNENVVKRRDGNYDITSISGAGLSEQYGNWLEDCAKDAFIGKNTITEGLIEMRRIIKTRVATDDYYKSLHIGVVSINMRFAETWTEKLKRERSESRYRQMSTEIKFDEANSEFSLFESDEN